MSTYQRRSPVSFPARPVKIENRDNWAVVLEYGGEGNGPYLIDLSHRAKWDVQDGKIDQIMPWTVSVPERPGGCILDKGILINRMNRTQVSVWHLSGNALETPDGWAFTEVTESSLLLALVGRDVFSVTEKITSLDFLDPRKQVPFLLQGPILHVPCQVVVLERNRAAGAILLTCPRGYAYDMVQAVLDAGEEFRLRPAGENVFSRWLESVSGGALF